MRRRSIVGRLKAGLLLNFAGHVACKVERVAADILEIGRARGKIDAARIARMLAHFAEHKGPVRAQKRPHAEAVEGLPVREAPVAPGQQACEIDLEIARGKARALEARVAAKQ